MKKRKTVKKTKAKKSKPQNSAIPPLHEDQVKAQELRIRLGKALEPVCLILDEAKACGLATNFNIQDTPPGQPTRINGININRKL